MTQYIHDWVTVRMNWVVTNALGREKLSNWAHTVPDTVAVCTALCSVVIPGKCECAGS